MTRSTTRFWLGCALLAAVSLAAAPAARAQSADSADDRWVPAWNTSFQLFRYEADGDLDSSVGFSDQGSDDKTLATFLIGLDMKSPALESVPLEPHVAFFAGIQAGPSQKVSLAGAGELAPLQPEDTVTRNPALANPSLYPGQGSDLTGRYEALGWYLGTGVVFDVPTTTPLRVRPFFIYSGEQAEIEGQVVVVTGTPNNYVVQRGKAKEDKVFHYIGPGIELEAVLTSGENVALSLYASFDFLWNVGDDTVKFSDSLAQYEYEADDFKPRGGIGVRVSWLSAF